MKQHSFFTDYPTVYHWLHSNNKTHNPANMPQDFTCRCFNCGKEFHHIMDDIMKTHPEEVSNGVWNGDAGVWNGDAGSLWSIMFNQECK